MLASLVVPALMTTSLTTLARADAVGIHRSGPLCPRFPLLCCDANPHTRATTTLQLVSVVADTVRLNVGGTKFTTTLSTLRAAPGSKLACGVEEWVDADGVVPGSQHLFIDSDPETFAWVLDFLRRGLHLVGTPPDHLLEKVRADAQLFGIDELVTALDEKISQAQAQPSYEYALHTVGPAHGLTAREVWHAELNRLSVDGWRLSHIDPMMHQMIFERPSRPSLDGGVLGSSASSSVADARVKVAAHLAAKGMKDMEWLDN